MCKEFIFFLILQNAACDNCHPTPLVTSDGESEATKLGPTQPIQPPLPRLSSMPTRGQLIFADLLLLLPSTRPGERGHIMQIYRGVVQKNGLFTASRVRRVGFFNFGSGRVWVLKKYFGSGRVGLGIRYLYQIPSQSGVIGY